MEWSHLVLGIAALAITVINYIFMSGRWVGGAAAKQQELEQVKLRLEARVTRAEFDLTVAEFRRIIDDLKAGLARNDAEHDRNMHEETDARHKLRAELMGIIAKIEERLQNAIDATADARHKFRGEIQTAMEGNWREMHRRCDALERRLENLERGRRGS